MIYISRGGTLIYSPFFITTGKCEGRKSYAEAMPDTVALAKALHANGLSYRKVAAELATQGHVTRTGKPHVASAVQKMLGR